MTNHAIALWRSASAPSHRGDWVYGLWSMALPCLYDKALLWSHLQHGRGHHWMMLISHFSN